MTRWQELLNRWAYEFVAGQGHFANPQRYVMGPTDVVEVYRNGQLVERTETCGHIEVTSFGDDLRQHQPDPSVNAEIKTEWDEGIHTTYTYEPGRIVVSLEVGCATCGRSVPVDLGPDPFGTALRGVLEVEDKEAA